MVVSYLKPKLLLLFNASPSPYFPSNNKSWFFSNTGLSEPVGLGEHLSPSLFSPGHPRVSLYRACLKASPLLIKNFNSLRRGWTFRGVSIALVLGSSAVATLFFSKVERIPFSRRFHVVLSDTLETKMGESQWESFMEKKGKKILPATDPRTKRVEAIAKRIIEGLNRGLLLERGYQVNGSRAPRFDAGQSQWGLKGSGGRKRKLLWKPTTRHLDGKNWEVYVVNSSTINAVCLLGGKIVVYSGLLKTLQSDAEIATVIGHEVGHAVARHIAEGILRLVWMAAMMLLIILSGSSSHAHSNGNALQRLSDLIEKFIQRRREAEADYIGLLLMASAGYDPRVAPVVYEHRLAEHESKVEWWGLFDSHFKGKKRAKLLRRPKRMAEAVEVYEKVRDGYGVKSFV